MPSTAPATACSDRPSSGLYSVVQIREIERRAQARLPPHALMQRAGLAAADLARTLIDAALPKHPIVPTTVDIAGSRGAPRVLIVAGPGNNGGDAFECGFHLATHGCQVTVLMPLPSSNPGPDVALALARIRTRRVTFVETTEAADLKALGAMPWSLVIDGLFGIGLIRALTGTLQAVVDCMNAIDAPLLALDVPSGLNADTGAVLPAADRQTGVCVRASHTLTFIADKPGLHTCEGRDHAGRVSVAGLDIDHDLLPAPLGWLSQPSLFAGALRARRHNSHKGSFGDVQIIGGASGMVGAALLAGHAALKSGSGRVLIGFADAGHAPQYDPVHPELMCRHADGLDFRSATLVVGPGLGITAAAAALVMRACVSDAPLVLDADALNLVASTPALATEINRRASRSCATLLTPHPLEAARLLQTSAALVQADRPAAAGALASRFHATIILKGSGTVIADTALLAINPNGNPALATGGTGDVLSGICGALLAQGWPARDAALGAVWLHGAAADRLVADGIGPTGVTASEIIDATRRVFNELIAAHGSA